VFLSSTQDNNDIQQVIQELQSYCRGGGVAVEDDNRIKMLYITPEKYSKSDQLNRMLKRLADARLLSRFIIDEAHCLSQVQCAAPVIQLSY
jgi:bloom syndrome protein